MKRYITVVALFLLVFLVGMRKAEAIPTMKVYDGATLIASIADGGVGDLNGLAGAVLYSGAFGNWTLTVDVGQTKPVIGNVADGDIDLNVTATSKNPGGTITIKWSDTGFLPPVVPTGISLATGGTTVGTVTVKGYADTTDTLFGTNTPIGTLGPYGAGAFSGTANGIVGGSPFSMTIVTKITHAGKGTTTLDAEQQVPEPATLLLLGAGLLGVGVFGRKKIKG